MALSLEARANYIQLYSAPPSVLLPTTPEYYPQDVVDWNQAVNDLLYQYQEATDEGCVLPFLCALSNAFYPHRPLPAAQQLLNDAITLDDARNDTTHLFKPGTVVLAHSRLPEVFREIFPSWGIHLSGYSLNSNGKKILGPGMKVTFGPPIQQLDTYLDLPTHHLTPPYGILLHQASDEDTHFVAIDGSEQASKVLRDYQQLDLPYRIIATFTFQT